jgi:cytochrome c oxidase cbb3-type subunit III
MPGRPKLEDRRPEPQHVTDFKQLFNQNCRGCHGDAGTVGPAIALNDPFYLAFIPQERMKQIITEGIPGTQMPTLALSHGGSLTDEQVDILVKGIFEWAKNPPPANLPPYSAPLGNVAQGAVTFGVACATCHGADGKGIKGKAGAVANPTFLGLVSDQYIRTIILAGRSDLGCPTFQNRIPGRAMTNEEISDVTAWLVSQRRNEFGQPLGAAAQPEVAPSHP